MASVLKALGLKVSRSGDTLDVDGSTLCHSKAPYDIVSRLRASFFVIGPLLARLGVARVPLPGGCAIGARPVALHIRGLQAMGAQVHMDHGTVHAYVPGSRNRLKGARIYLDYPSVGATETLMMAATLAEGETIIENAAQEPEVEDLANFCRAMGAKIRGAGTNAITIVGVPHLHSADYGIIPDRIEAGTFMLAAAITRSELTLGPVLPDHITPLLSKLHEVGCRIVEDGPAGCASFPETAFCPRISKPVLTQASRQICRRSLWRCLRWQMATAWLPKPCLRIVSSTLPNSIAWGQTFALKAMLPSFEVSPNCRGHRSRVRTYGPRLRWWWLAWPQRGKPPYTGCVTWTAATPI